MRRPAISKYHLAADTPSPPARFPSAELWRSGKREIKGFPANIWQWEDLPTAP
jgi:hypothetical protein